MTERSSRPLSIRLAVVATVAALAFLLRGRFSPKDPLAPPASGSAPVDAAPSPDRGRPGRATVVVYDEGQPMKDRWVVFHESDGSVITSMKSGPDGTASAEIHAGAMITVAYGTSVRRLVTITGVQLDDEVLVGEKDDDEAAAGDSVAKAKVKLPGALATSERYGVSLGVGVTDVADPTVPVPMRVLRRYLVEEKKFPVLGLAFGTDADPVAYTFAWGTLAGTDAGDVVDVRLPAWSRDWRQHRFVLTAPPAAGGQAIDASLAIVSGEDRFECGRRNTALAGDGDTTLRFAVPKPLGETAIFRLELVAHVGSTDKTVFSRRIKAIAPETHLDLRSMLLPRVSNAKIERTHDAARPRAQWEVTGDPAKVKAVFVQLSWPETKEHVWTIVGPASTKPGLEVPALPAALAEWRPDARPIAPAVALVDASEYESYADVRKKGIHLVGEPPEDDDAIVNVSSTGADLVH